MPKRAIGIIIRNNKILLIRRIKNGKEYYVFPGGGVEEELIEDAATREIKEELSLNVSIDKLLFEIENQNRKEYYFLIKEFTGMLKLGGEEKERMNKDNQYYPQWVDLDRLSKLDNLYPELARKKVIELYKTAYFSDLKSIRIRHIIFDAGKVIIRSRKNNLRKLSRELKISEEKIKKIISATLKEKVLSKDPNDKRMFERSFSGILSWSAYRKILTEIYEAEKVNKTLIRWISQNKRKYQVSILTNNSILFRRLLKEKFKIYYLFDFIFNSAEIGLVKPDPRIFRYVIEKLETLPKECLFVDNKIENIRMAEKIGFQTILFHSNKEFFERTKELGL